MIKPFFKDIRKAIIDELKRATTEINIAVCWFTSYELFDVLCVKLKENISVSLIVLNDGINNSPDALNFQEFIDLGGIFHYSDAETPMHNKYCIIDETILITGSYNWTYFAENKNEENIIILKDKRIAELFLSDFKRLSEKFKLVSSVKDDAKGDSQQNTIVENARIATETDIIIKNKKVFDGSELTIKSSIGESIHEDKFYVFIPKGSKVPIEKTHTLTTIEDNQTSCKTDIRFGENSLGSLNQEIGCFSIEDIPPMEKGKPGLITTFSVDIYGILTVIIKVRESGTITIHKFNIEHLII